MALCAGRPHVAHCPQCCFANGHCAAVLRHGAARSQYCRTPVTPPALLPCNARRRFARQLREFRHEHNKVGLKGLKDATRVIEESFLVEAPAVAGLRARLAAGLCFAALRCSRSTLCCVGRRQSGARSGRGPAALGARTPGLVCPASRRIVALVGLAAHHAA